MKKKTPVHNSLEAVQKYIMELTENSDIVESPMITEII